MITSILIGIGACIAGVAIVREALRRRHPEEAASMGSVSQSWMAEHRVGRTDEGPR